MSIRLTTRAFLQKRDGQMHTFDDARVLAKTSKVIQHRVFKSPWKFKQHGALWTARLGTVPAHCPSR